MDISSSFISYSITLEYFAKHFFFQEKPSSMLAMEFAYFQMSVTMTEVAGGHLNRRKRQIQLTSFMQSRS